MSFAIGRAPRQHPLASRRPADPLRAATSVTGLRLGRAPLTLGLAAPAAVHPPFRPPPTAGLLFNLDSGRVLWQRNALRRVRIASLTKMMTALLVVEHAPPTAPALITRQAVDFAGSGIGLLPYGRRVPVEDLLDGLLLPSGNDAAIALAQHVAGSVPGFVSLMNQRAAALGLGCTRYSSPSGYYDQGNFSCAADLAELAHADLAQPRIAAITRRALIEVRFPIKGGKLFLTNNNPLVLGGYPGITGLKTGFTTLAGSCLVATAERHGVRLAVVLLHSPDPGAQARTLLDRGFGGVYRQRTRPTAPSGPLVPTGRVRAGARPPHAIAQSTR